MLILKTLFLGGQRVGARTQKLHLYNQTLKLKAPTVVTVVLAVCTIDHFTVVDLVTWPLNGSEAGGDLVLIQTSLLLLCKSSCSYAN